MNYLGIDPGKTWGWACFDSFGNRVLHGAEKFVSLAQFEQRLKALIEGLDIHAVVTCRAMGKNQQVIRFHSSMAAMVEYFCEKRGTSYFDVADVTMRKQVVGRGNAKKPEVMSFLGMENEHAADAMVGARYLAKVTV